MLFLYSDRATLSNVKITVKELIVRVTDNYYQQSWRNFPGYTRAKHVFTPHCERIKTRILLHEYIHLQQ